jgi:hypothetical protein
MQIPRGSIPGDISSVIGMAVSDILTNICLHAKLVVLRAEKVVCLITSRVSYRRLVMSFLDQVSR